jgi:hypothetical protein
MKLQKIILNTPFFIVMFTLHSMKTSERGTKRKYEPSSQNMPNVSEDIAQKKKAYRKQKKAYQDKVHGTWNKCLLPDLNYLPIGTEDDLIPGFYDTVHRDAQELLPYEIIIMIIEYCARYTFSATVQRWDLTTLTNVLGLSAADPFNEPFGLVKISQKYVWISAQRNFGYQTFKVPLTKGDKVSYSCARFAPLAIDRHVRCGAGILTRIEPGIQLRSLKDGDMLAAWNTPHISRLYAINSHHMAVQLLLHNSKNTENQIFIVKRTFPITYTTLKDHATNKPLSIYGNTPDNVILCQPTNLQEPWVVVFHIVRTDERHYKRVMDIFEITQGKHLTRIVHPEKLLYVHEDKQSIVCARNAETSDFQEFSHIVRYAIPSGEIISQSNLTTYIDDCDPLKERTFVMSAYSKKSSAKKWNNIALGVHPTYGRPLILARNIDDYSVQQNIANKRGDIAAIMQDLITRKQQLIVWRVTSK